MHRQPLLAQLDRYLAAHPMEAAMVERVRELVAQHADCFERTCMPGHVTGSAWVTTPDGSHALLVHHRKLDRWLQPGGHADGDADVARVALREAVEETGLAQLELASPAAPLDVDVHVIPARYNKTTGELAEPAHEHHDVRFLVVSLTPAPPIVSDESHAVRWFRTDDLASVTDEESVLRLARKATAFLQSQPVRSGPLPFDGKG